MKFFKNYAKCLPLLQYHQTRLFNSKLFLRDQYSEFTFSKINYLSYRLSEQLLESLKVNDLNGEKIGVFCSNNYTYLISLLAIWRLKGVPMCLSKLYPINYLDYFITDSKCKLIINGINTNESISESTVNLNALTQNKNTINFILNENEFFNLKQVDNSLIEMVDLQNFKNDSRDSLLLYTSGTSGQPKGVLHTFTSLTSCIEAMIKCWEFKMNDHILSVLPLHHFSGLVYSLLTPFYIKAQVDLLPKFNAELVWSKLLSNESNINLFIGVPTVFNQLIEVYDEKLKNKYDKEFIKFVLNKKMRLIGSGSSALNVKTYNEWFDLTNYKLLERYGMTEIGMAISNPHIESNDFKKTAGCVGRPCFNCKIRLADQNGKILIESDQYNDSFSQDQTEIFGELQVKGPILFKEYFNKKKQTNDSFTEDGWFKTGDTAEYLKNEKIYKIIGRTSVDIIKTGGYKISALDVERVIFSYPFVVDCAVMGLNDSKWGQVIFALIQPKHNDFDETEFKNWCRQNLPKYSVPSRICLIDKIPRNQLGKVNKKELIQIYEKKLLL